MEIGSFQTIGSDYMQTVAGNIKRSEPEDESFGSVFASAMNMINQTNDLQNKAQSAEIQFALGESDNTHDLLIAESKALVALQYTVAVRDKILESYNQIMQMQI